MKGLTYLKSSKNLERRKSDFYFLFGIGETTTNIQYKTLPQLQPKSITKCGGLVVRTPDCHTGGPGSNPQSNLFEEKFFLCLCFTIKLIPESRNLYLSTPMDDFSIMFLLQLYCWVSHLKKPLFSEEEAGYGKIRKSRGMQFCKYWIRKNSLA